LCSGQGSCSLSITPSGSNDHPAPNAQTELRPSRLRRAASASRRPRSQ
jgi:hypothetical protein